MFMYLLYKMLFNDKYTLFSFFGMYLDGRYQGVIQSHWEIDNYCESSRVEVEE